MLKLLINGGRHLIPSLHHSPNPLCYSTSQITSQKLNLAVDFLIKSLGFSTEQAISTVHKLRPFKSSENPNSVFEFFKSSGFDDTQIKSIVNSFPGVLSINVTKTLEPKIRVLEGLGLNQNEIIKLVTCPGGFLHRSLGSCILPGIEAMRSILGSDENVVRVFRKLPVSSNRGMSRPKCLAENVELLRSRGMSREGIRKLMMMSPGLFTWKTSSLEALIGRVEAKLGIAVDTNRFLYGMYALRSMSDESLDAKFGAFRGCGWDDSDILILARANPVILATSERKVKEGVQYFMRELGYDPQFIAAHPALLSYSMEKRVRPRNAVLQVLKDKKLIKESFGLYSALVDSESKFLERFVEPFKESVPNIYEVYRNCRTVPAKADK